MAKRHRIKYSKTNDIKPSIFDKVLFLLTGLSTFILFLLDVCTNVLDFGLKWQIILGLVTVLSGFFVIISFCFDKKFKDLEKRIVLSEKSIIESQNIVTNSIRSEFENKLTYLHDLYSYQASTNKDFKEYALKEVEELIGKLNRLCSNGESEILDEIAYYEKLNQLADKIKDDQQKYNLLDETAKQTLVKPIIWALTCFNEDEWGDEIKNEDEWSDRLEELTAYHGVAVERICILSEEIQNFIKIDNEKEINEKLETNKRIKSFMGFLLRYYGDGVIGKYKKNTLHFAFFDNISSDLYKTGGFFGICLSNGEKHIVKGDCNAEKNESTARIVFSCDNLYNEFITKKQHRPKLESYLNNNASVAFISFLKAKNIKLV